MVSKWSAVLFGHCPPKKWRTKELLSCSKLSMDDVGNLLNHSLTAPLRVVGKERHKISSGGCWRPRVVRKVFKWSNGSFSLSKGSSCGRRNLEGTGHSWMATVKGESVFLTILSKLWSIFPLMAFLNLSISFLISLRRSELASSGVLFRLLLLSSSSSLLTSVQLSSCCNRYLISWFCLVSSSTVAASDWICRANAAGSGLALDSIWTCELIRTDHLLSSNRSPQTVPNWWCLDHQSNVIVQIDVVLSQSDLKEWMERRRNVGHQCGACQKAFDAKVRKISQRNVKKSIF